MDLFPSVSRVATKSAAGGWASCSAVVSRETRNQKPETRNARGAAWRSAPAAALCGWLAVASASLAAPKVIVISLDGATPRYVERFLASGVLPRDEGIGLLKKTGTYAGRTVTANPSLTATAHISIATGASASRTDIPANSFHPLAATFQTNFSGFGAPIGGYKLEGPAPAPNPTAEPIWVALRQAGKKVVCATFPGADGVNVVIPGTNGNVVQSAGVRTVDYTVPFGEFAGAGAAGFSLTAADFGPPPQSTVEQLQAAGILFANIVQKTTPLETVQINGQLANTRVSYVLHVAALDTTDDNTVNYDTLVFFDEGHGIQPSPFQLPSTGPAYVKAADRRSQPFYFEESSRKSGCAFYVSHLAPDLSVVRFARYSAYNIPRLGGLAVLANVDDINNNVGFWLPQPDFRIPEKLSPGFAAFPDDELEAIYLDQVETWSDYQADVAIRAIDQNHNADLVMLYSEQPDGSEHQFLLIDPRQPSNPLDPASIGVNQDRDKVKRYAGYVQRAYQAGSGFVQRVIEKVGRRSDGRPRSNIIVTSDHGFAPFHTAVSMSNILVNAGLPAAQVRAVTSGPAANLYINLQNRGPDGTVNPETYIALQAKILDVLRKLIDTNPNYTFRRRSVPVFSKVYARPLPADLSDPTLGRRTSTFVGQDFGDVFALLNVGYNFDGTQSPVVPRLGDSVTNNPPLSVPNFYGAHGYDPELPEMSASFYAAGPDIRPNSRGIATIRTIDIAPTVARILGVTPSSTVQGEALDLGRAPLQLLSAVSRKKHGAAGEFDIPLPLNGSFGIECRKPEGMNSHTLVFTFSNPIIAGTAQLATGNASVKPALEGNTLIVKLVDVPDRQVLNLTLRDVSDGRTTLPPINVAVGMLLGDVTADRMVNAGDLNEVRAGAAQNTAPDASSFRADLRTNGRTGRADVILCEENAGHSL